MVLQKIKKSVLDTLGSMSPKHPLGFNKARLRSGGYNHRPRSHKDYDDNDDDFFYSLNNAIQP